MLSLYLSSLYTLLIDNNPIRLLFLQSFRTLKACFNLRKNMRLAQQRMVQLNRQYQTVAAYIDNPKTHTRKTTFDVYR